MKTVYHFITVLMLIASQTIAADQRTNSTCVGDVTISSQAEADAFDCTEVTGNLSITGGDITDLSGLSELTRVGGKLFIKNNPNLIDVKPLTSLRSVGSLIVVNNDLLRNLNGLLNLDTISDNLSVKDNWALINFTGLGNVRKLVNLEISGNPNLENVDGLDKLEEAEVLLINSNVSMKNVDGLSRLLLLTHMQITMTGNIAMENCCGLYNLWTSGTVYGAIDINNNGAPCSREDVIFSCDPNESTCFASAVISYNPGTTKDGRPVQFERAFPMKALGTPQENDNLNFVSLGFGGNITLRLGDDLYDDGTTNPEFILVETSFGLASARCFENGTFNNPESVFIELSSDGQNWYSLPNIQCRTTFIDIKPAADQGLPFARFVKITDTTNPFYFNGEADGFDVDGLIICSEEVLAGLDRLTDARKASGSVYNPDFVNTIADESRTFSEVRLFPNPSTNNMVWAEFEATREENSVIEVIDLNGRTVISEDFKSVIGYNKVGLNLEKITQGQYIIQIKLSDNTFTGKIVK